METVLGGLIKKKRKEKGLTQYEVSSLVGVSQSTISQWESGLRTSSKEFFRLIPILGISNQELAPFQDVICDDVERAIVNSDLNTRAKDILLRLYGVLADRESPKLAEMYLATQYVTMTDTGMDKLKDL